MNEFFLSIALLGFSLYYLKVLVCLFINDVTRNSYLGFIKLEHYHDIVLISIRYRLHKTHLVIACYLFEIDIILCEY